MICRYDHLARHSQVFLQMTGLRLNEFDQLLIDMLPRIVLAEQTRLQRAVRRRACGGGRHADLSLTNQLLLCVIWLRQYPTNEVLAFLFGVSDSTVSRVIARVQRSKDRDDADAHYSGKKKQHTLKSQVAVDEETGEICDVADSVNGPTADITLLKQSLLMERLPERVGGIGDLAYVGIADVHPHGLGASPRRKPRGRDRPAEDICDNRAFSKRRIVVEHSIGRLRRYQSLAQMDRHHREHHTSRTRAVAGLVNRQIRSRLPC